MKLPAAFAPIVRLRRWAAWIEQIENGHRRKVPYLGLKWRASTRKPETWGSLEAASSLAATFADMGQHSGVGVLLGEMPGGHDRLICVDLDAARTPSTGELVPWASELLRRCPTLVEVSPSGRGLHLLAFTTDADLVAAGVPHKKGRAINTSWKEPSPPGVKAPGVDLLITGYSTISGQVHPASAQRIERLSVEALRWLVHELGPSLTGQPPQARASQLDHSAPAATEQPQRPQGIPTVRVSPTRLSRLAAQLDDAAMQLLAALWLHARKAELGMWPVSVSQEELCRLAGARGDGRRTPKALRPAEATLAGKGMVRVVEACRPPYNGRGGVATARAVIPPYVHDPRQGARADLIHVPRDVWKRMLGSLRPRPLRLFLWLLGSFHGAGEFSLSLRPVGKALRIKPERVAKDLAALVAEGWLIEVTAPDAARCRPGSYWVKSWSR